MKYIAQTYEEFLNEDHAPTAWSASTYNTPGMGNVSTVNGTFKSNFADISSGDQDATRIFHTDLVIEDDGTDGWMRPSGDYSKRNWLLPNFVQYMNLHQSNARFQIGDRVVCVDRNMPCFGKIGKIVSFEDATIRFEILNSETGVGQTAEQYRCYAGCLKKI